MKKRVYEVSLLNVIFTLLVIFIHVSSDALMALDKTRLPYVIIMTLWRMSTFVVQGFIFLSGFKMFYGLSEPINYKKYYLSKLKKIFLPYILWVIIYYFCYLYKGHFTGENHLILIIKYIISGNISAQFYFIVVIAQFYLLLPLWVWLKNKVSPTFAIVGSFLIMYLCSTQLPVMLANRGIYFLYNDRIFTTYLFYFVFGIYAATEYEKFTSILKKKFITISLAFFLMLAVNTVITYMWQTQRLTGFIIDSVHIIYCLCAIVFIYALVIRCERISTNHIIKNIDGSSYYIYLTHMLFVLGINYFMAQQHITSVWLTYSIRIIFVYSASLIICIGYSKLKKNLIQKKT